MAEWNDNIKHPKSSINNGEQYTKDDNVTLESLNNSIENSFYAVRIAENAQSATNNAVSYNTQTPSETEQLQAQKNLNIDKPIAFAESERQKSKNLFNINNCLYHKSTNLGETGTAIKITESNLRITLDPNNLIKVKPNTQYILSTNNSSFKYAIGQLTSSKTTLGDSGWQTNSSFIITTTSTTEYLGLNFGKTDDSEISSTDYNNFLNSNIQIEQGSVATNYQSYNGAISHSNDTPIQFAKEQFNKQKNLLGVIGSSDGVVSINTDGLITFNYILPVESADYSVNILKNYIYLKKGHTYTFSIQNYTNISGVGRQLITCGARKLSDNTYISDYLYIANNETTKTITPTEDVYIVLCNFYGYYPDVSITANFSCYLQLEENSIMTDYIKYQGGRFVQKGNITPDLIYDKDTKNVIDGTAYSNGLLNNTSYNIDFNKYKKISVNIGYYNVRTCIVIDFTTTAETDGLWHYGTCIWAFAPNTIVRIELIANKNSIKVVGTKIDASETVFDGDIMRILRIEGVK